MESTERRLTRVECKEIVDGLERESGDWMTERRLTRVRSIGVDDGNFTTQA